MSEPDSNVVLIKIYDREYALRTDGAPALLRKLCTILDQRMKSVADSSGTVDTLKVAILAALSFADELSRTQNELREMDQSVSRRSLECVTLLDRFFSK
jgi:cell division protein ZapA (FtsZ GTPase activity inhibitor)